jgi:deazaflavin-dependent oxidoreductase (nitroreductase family)
MVWPRVKRWLYRGGRPHALVKRVNDGVARMHAAGVGPPSWVTLEVTGRRSGRTHTFPLVMTDFEGERYLVSMLGNDAAWVRNVEAAGGRAVLRRSGEQPVRLEPVPVERRAPVLKAYLREAPGARPHLPVDQNATLARFEEIAAQFPVFRVVVEATPGS